MVALYIVLLLHSSLLYGSDEKKPILRFKEPTENSESPSDKKPSIIMVVPDKNAVAGTCVCEMDIPCPKKDKDCCVIQ